MPVRDHFHPPSLEGVCRGNRCIAVGSRKLPADSTKYCRKTTSPSTGCGSTADMEIDIGVAEDEESVNASGTNGVNGSGGTAVATARRGLYASTGHWVGAFRLPRCRRSESFHQSRRGETGRGDRAGQPRNKDRNEKREAFVAKCLDYLASGASVVIVDIVTDRHANLHNEIVQRMSGPASLEITDESSLYAVSYRPVVRNKRSGIDVWVNPFAVGDPLPTMPLRLIADYFVPVELETTYTEACRRRRLI